jgi:hypothetical protein
MTNNMSSTFDTLIAAERQFTGAMKHYRGTWDAILRTPSLVHRPVLYARASDIRLDVVRRMAYQHWVRRNRPEGSPLYDWLVAEGVLRPEKCRT